MGIKRRDEVSLQRASDFGSEGRFRPRIKASNAGFGFNCDTLFQIETLPGVSPRAVLETIGREKRKQAEFGNEKAELSLMTSAYAPGNRADRRPSCRSGPKGKTAAGKRLCHPFPISTATQIQSFLFLLAAARLPQQAACVAISIPAWSSFEFSCCPTRNRQPKKQRPITVPASLDRERSRVRFI